MPDQAEADQDLARRQFRRVGLWGIVGAIRQNMGLVASEISKRQGGQAEIPKRQGGQAEIPEIPAQLARMLEEVPFGNQVTIHQAAPAAPASIGSSLAKWLGPIVTAAAIAGGAWWFGRESAPEPAPVDATLEWEIGRDGTATLTGHGEPAP